MFLDAGNSDRRACVGLVAIGACCEHSGGVSAIRENESKPRDIESAKFCKFRITTSIIILRHSRSDLRSDKGAGMVQVLGSVA